MPIIARENGTDMQLVPVGPSPDVLQESGIGALLSENFRSDLNRLSVVLALTVRSKTKDFNALLAADTDGEGFRSALGAVKAKTKVKGDQRFDVIKVAHHGSLASHENSPACSCRKSIGECVATVSTGHFEVLPDREVLRAYLDHKWKVLLTTKRIEARSQPLLYAFGKKPVRQVTHRKYDLRITWSEERGMQWTPQEAALDDSELGAYQTASKAKTGARAKS